MSIKQSDKNPNSYENCITVERLKARPTAKASVVKRNEFKKGKKFERIPILRGYIMREVK